jgi:hypothetical protein
MPGFASATVIRPARARQLLAGRARRGVQAQFAERKIPLVQQLQQFLTDGAGRADDADCEGGRFAHR